MLDIEIKRKQLLYRSIYRGCKETDLLIGEFAANYINSFSEQELKDYEQLLEIGDLTLYNLICEKEGIANDDINPELINLIINFNKKKNNAT